MARFDKGNMARFGKMWQDLTRGTWQDFARFDKGGHGKIWQELARFGKIWQDLTRGDMARFGKM